MSYEICVLDPALAETREAAYSAWNDGKYYDTSTPVADRAAPKWRIKDALIASDTGLVFLEPKTRGEPGLLSKVFGEKKAPPNLLYVRAKAEDESTTYQVFDQAVEIDLPWDAEHENVERIVQDLWRNLGKLQAAGLTTLYDTERNELLNIETDFEWVLKGYIKNLGLDGATDDEDESPEATSHAEHADVSLLDPANTAPSAPQTTSQPSSNQPFTGNVDGAGGKPWWKVW